MKRFGMPLVAAACVLALSTGALAQLPSPSHGYNLGDTLEPPCGVGCWGPYPTKALFDRLKAEGYNTVRVPCAWKSNTDRSGNISPTFMAQVQQVVDWCYADGLYVIINDHRDGGWFETTSFRNYSSRTNTTLQSLWTQIANHFASYDSHLLFAVANEPNAGSQLETNTLFQYYRNWVTTIRNTGGNNATRWLILQGPNTNIGLTSSYVNSSIWPNDPAKHLMIECHYYDPWQFCGATSGGMFYFWGAQYHTVGLASRNATFMEEAWVDDRMSLMQTQFANAGIPVLIGEFESTPKPAEPDLTGQYITQNYNSTTYWDYYVTNSIINHGLYGTCWNIFNQTYNWTTGAIVDQNYANAFSGRLYVPPIQGL